MKEKIRDTNKFETLYQSLEHRDSIQKKGRTRRPCRKIRPAKHAKRRVKIDGGVVCRENE